MTDFTPETPVLTPIRDHAAELAKAEAGVAEMAAKRNNRWYPKYHIASNSPGVWHIIFLPRTMPDKSSVFLRSPYVLLR